MIIGVTGTDGGGKGTVVEYLVAQKGFAHGSARTLLVTEMERRGLEISRANMRITANSLRAEYGNDYLIQEYLRRQEKEGWGNLVIDSVRTLAEVETLKKYGGVLIAIDADQKTRFARIQSRASESDKVTFEEFVAQEELEMNDPDPNGMQKAKVIGVADYTIQNNGTLEELHQKTDHILGQIKK